VTTLLPPDTPPVIDPAWLIKFTGLSRPTVYGLIRDRRIASIRVGRTIRLMRDDVEKFLVSVRQEAVDATA
jgi:excisionase family DNA binding protein